VRSHPCEIIAYALAVCASEDVGKDSWNLLSFQPELFERRFEVVKDSILPIK
jgi:hypothetical protein